MSSDVDQLVEMGFERERAELALQQSSSNLQSAIDWLEKNQDRSIEEIKQSSAEKSDAANDDTAASLVCQDCGKRMRSHEEAEFHATKSGHTNFSESTEEIAPLTEEQKKEKIEALKQKRDERRAAAAEVEKAERKRNEEIRKKTTKEQQDIKEELEKKQKIKEAEKKRQEKQDDVDAKRRIQMKIAADKEERRRKAEEEKARRDGQSVPPQPVSGKETVTTQQPVTSKPTSAYTETRLRLQTPAGSIMKSFPIDTTLFEVAHAAAEEKGFQVTSFQQNMPRKTWDTTDFGLTLKEAGLVPSASLIVR